MSISCFSYSIGKTTIKYVRDTSYSTNECGSLKSLAGWTFALSSYYEQNITKYLDDTYFQLLSVIIDPYSINIYNSPIEYNFCNLAYFYRFHNLKFLQFQAADDQYFPPDSEVIILFK